jgi:uncharacterized membrane protein
MIEDKTGAPAQEPLRVYVGLNSADDPRNGRRWRWPS